MLATKKKQQTKIKTAEHPAPVKNTSERERRIVFVCHQGAPHPRKLATVDIMLEINGALAAAKLLWHMRQERLTYNLKGNLSGLVPKDSRADFLLPKYRKMFLKKARQQDPDIIDATVNEK